jgi:prepilin-type N-terminal cleavage/methylation domain-containing protein/prepilin-type processing-associated H-X9-DG protein
MRIAEHPNEETAAEVQFRSTDMKRKAFTLIELLVVIAIIAVLMGILMPSLRLARDHAKRIHCVSNMKTLALGWYMYKDDNDDKLVPGNTDPGNWVGRPPENATLEQQKQAIRDGELFNYVGKAVDLYHCPADTRKQGIAVAFLTFSMAGGANGESWTSYEKCKLYSDIKRPATRYIFVEEADNRGTNVGSWQMNPNNRTWTDPVAMWHNRKSTLAFADGHAEMHPWQDKSFIDWNLKAMYDEGFSFGMTPPTEDFLDIDYMTKGFPYKSLK